MLHFHNWKLIANSRKNKYNLNSDYINDHCKIKESNYRKII